MPNADSDAQFWLLTISSHLTLSRISSISRLYKITQSFNQLMSWRQFRVEHLTHARAVDDIAYKWILCHETISYVNARQEYDWQWKTECSHTFYDGLLSVNTLLSQLRVITVIHQGCLSELSHFLPDSISLQCWQISPSPPRMELIAPYKCLCEYFIGVTWESDISKGCFVKECVFTVSAHGWGRCVQERWTGFDLEASKRFCLHSSVSFLTICLYVYVKFSMSS